MTWATAATHSRCAAHVHQSAAIQLRRHAATASPMLEQVRHQRPFRIGQAAAITAARGFAPMRRRVAVASGLGWWPSFHRTPRRLDPHNPRFLQCPAHRQAAHLHPAALCQKLCHHLQRRPRLLGHDLLQGQHMLFFQRSRSASTVRLPGQRILAGCTHAVPPDLRLQAS